MWKTVKLGDIATVIAGQSPTGENYNKEGLGMPFYQGKKDYGDKFLKPPTVWTKSVTKIAIEGDVLISVRAPVGALNIATDEICIGRGLAAIRVHAEIDKDYLFYALAQISNGLTGSSGAIFNSINKNQIESIEFQLPPLAEQQRIVAKLDTAFAEIDTAIAAAEKNAENAEALFGKILDGIFSNNNSDWISAELKEVTTKIGSGATPRGGKSAYKEEGLSLIRSMNVHDLRFKHKDLAKIDDEQADKLSNATVLKGDVLLNITGASVARCSLVDESILPARVNQHVAIVRPIENSIYPAFLAYMLVSENYKRMLLEVGEGGGATRQAITKAQIENFRICFPINTTTQITITEKLDGDKVRCDELAIFYREKATNLSALKSSLLG